MSNEIETPTASEEEVPEASEMEAKAKIEALDKQEGTKLRVYALYEWLVERIKKEESGEYMLLSTGDVAMSLGWPATPARKQGGKPSSSAVSAYLQELVGLGLLVRQGSRPIRVSLPGETARPEGTVEVSNIPIIHQGELLTEGVPEVEVNEPAKPALEQSEEAIESVEIEYDAPETEKEAPRRESVGTESEEEMPVTETPVEEAPEEAPIFTVGDAARNQVLSETVQVEIERIDGAVKLLKEFCPDEKSAIGTLLTVRMAFQTMLNRALSQGDTPF